MADPSAMPVEVHGFTWTAAGAWGSFFTLLALLVRQWVPLRKIKQDADDKLRADLIGRVDKLEGRLDTERDRHAAEIAAMHAEHDAEIRIMRHRVNNLTQCFEAFVLMARKIPEAADVIQAVTEMRERQIVAEAEEKARIDAAKIEAASRRAAAI